MKVEILYDALTLTIQSNTVESHATMTHHRAAIEESARRLAALLSAELRRLVAEERAVAEPPSERRA